MDCSPPGSSVHGIFQARILEWVVIPFSRGSSWLKDWTQVSCIAGQFFTIWAILYQLSHKGSWSKLEWVAYPFSSGSSWPMNRTRVSALQADSLPAEPQGKPKNTGVGSLSLLQRIFLTQQLSQGLLHCSGFFTSWDTSSINVILCGFMAKTNMRQNIYSL